MKRRADKPRERAQPTSFALAPRELDAWLSRRVHSKRPWKGELRASIGDALMARDEVVVGAPARG